jgi:epoxyqueuosine reductase
MSPVTNESVSPDALASRIKDLAAATGFDLAGIARLDPPPHLDFVSHWLERGFAAGMTWMATQEAKRRDIHLAFPWAKSIVSVGLQYDTPSPLSTKAPPDRGWISRYAWGEDYHDVLASLLDGLAARIQDLSGPFTFRRYVDTGPIAERVWAHAAGLGAWGKNTCLLHPEHGSFFFLGELVTDLDLTADRPRTDLCGSCRACLDACPTGALPEPYVLDARRCISYLTIEERGSIPEQWRASLGRHVFGCDICQDVCPWNRKRRHRGPAAFEPREGLLAPDLAELASLDLETFRERFRRSPMKRTKRRGLLRNVAVALGNTGGPPNVRLLEMLAQDDDPVVREHAAWALARRGQPTCSPQRDSS